MGFYKYQDEFCLEFNKNIENEFIPEQNDDDSTDEEIYITKRSFFGSIISPNDFKNQFFMRELKIKI
jgi:hypothetical protein